MTNAHSTMVNDAENKLLSLDTVRARFAASEPLTSEVFPTGSSVRFRVQPGWNFDLDSVQGDDPVDAYLSVSNREYQLSKDALLEGTSLVGLPKGYVGRTPANYIEDQLNYWFRDGWPEKQFQLLATGEGQIGSALTRSTIVPFSNLRLLDEAEAGLRKHYGTDTLIVADKKFHHSLRQTSLRLVVPEASRIIKDSGTPDDKWSAGIQVSNSLTGASQTSLEGYLFRWWCTNGAIDELASSGQWSRRSGGQGEDVYDWAREAVDSVLGGLEHSFDKVQSLTSVEIPGEVNDVLRELFSTYRVPGPQRQSVIDYLVDQDTLTMYEVMQAVTQAANADDIEPSRAEHMMRVGGNFATAEHARCNSCHRVSV